MTTQTPDAVREAVQEALNLLKNAQMAGDGRRVTLHPTRVRLVSDLLAAALDSRAGDAGEGWKLVPVEMTREMSDAGRDATGGYPYAPHDIPKLGYMQVNIIWNAILAATPAPAVDAQEDGEPAAWAIAAEKAASEAYAQHMGSPEESDPAAGRRAAALAIQACAPAVDAVPAGEDLDDWLRGDWYERWQDATENADEELMATLESLRGRVEQTIRAALSHGEGRK